VHDDPGIHDAAQLGHPKEQQEQDGRDERELDDGVTAAPSTEQTGDGACHGI
jgi:hypothetical protein